MGCETAVILLSLIKAAAFFAKEQGWPSFAMVSAALHPNLANVSMVFALCSALYVRMILLVLFWSRIPPISAALSPMARQTRRSPHDFSQDGNRASTPTRLAAGSAHRHQLG